jgi:hypothetical protein
MTGATIEATVDKVTKGGLHRFQLGQYGDEFTGMIYAPGTVKKVKVTIEVIE